MTRIFLLAQRALVPPSIHSHPAMTPGASLSICIKSRTSTWVAKHKSGLRDFLLLLNKADSHPKTSGLLSMVPGTLNNSSLSCSLSSWPHIMLLITSGVRSCCTSAFIANTTAAASREKKRKTSCLYESEGDLHEDLAVYLRNIFLLPLIRSWAAAWMYSCDCKHHSQKPMTTGIFQLLRSMHVCF